MLSKTANHNKRKGTTRLAAIRVNEIDDSLEVCTASDYPNIVVRKLHTIRRDPNNSNAY
jgi:hypothetical protein